MLGKLIKHDFISGARRMSTIYLIEAIAIIAMIVTSYFQNGSMLKYISLAAVVLVAFAAVIVTLVSIVFGANKSLFGRQGYLTQTLPARSSSIIFSKWLVSSIWVTISLIIAVFAVAIVYVYADNDSGSGDAYGIFEMIKNMVSGFGVSSKALVSIFTFELAVKGLLTTFMFILCVLFAMTVGNIRGFDKLGMVGIILYVVVFIGVSIAIAKGLESLCDITLIIPYAEGAKTAFAINPDIEKLNEDYLTRYYLCHFTGLYSRILLSVPAFLLTVTINERKINLK